LAKVENHAEYFFVTQQLVVGLLPKIVLKMQKAYKHCQSCGMPLRRDELGGGTNADGSKSLMYCSHCWQQGAFSNPNFTVEEMKAHVKQKLQSFGFPGFIAGIFTRNIPKLERWK
jgi:hypothetical protein